MLDKDIRWIGKFGIERETLRVDANGRLAQTKHIFTEDAISRDFCENQIELITPVCDSIEGALESLKGLSQKVTKKLAENGEYLWLSSNPPYIEGEDEIPIARFDPVHSGKQQYRFNLEQRYGKKLMLYSGVHFNLSFCDAFIGNDKNAFYLKLLKYALKYSWLVTMLTAASPVYDASFDEKGANGSKFTGGASMRNGERGYWNQFVPVLDYTNLDTYCDSIQKYIDKGALFSESELYMPVRIKSKGAYSLKNMKADGVDHLELRMLDLNPLFEYGISLDDLKFMHILMVYFAEQKDFIFDESQQKLAVEQHKAAARMDWNQIKIKNILMRDVANDMLLRIEKHFNEDSEVTKILEKQRKKLQIGKRYVDRIYSLHKDDFQNSMLQLSKKVI